MHICRFGAKTVEARNLSDKCIIPRYYKNLQFAVINPSNSSLKLLIKQIIRKISTKPTLPTTYSVPKVWNSTPGEGVFKGMNRPTAGARDDRKLPIGKHDLQLYSLGTPNGNKVTILLEELGIEYDAWYIDIMKLDQFGSEFVNLNPNSKIPVLQDRSLDPPLRVFESVSILLYLAEKYGKFIPKDIHLKTEMMNWVIWNVGTAPFIGGGFGHFYHYAPVHIEYAIDRYTMETKRIVDVLDKHLDGKKFILGEEYSLAGEFGS